MSKICSACLKAIKKSGTYFVVEPWVGDDFYYHMHVKGCNSTDTIRFLTDAKIPHIMMTVRRIYAMQPKDANEYPIYEHPMHQRQIKDDEAQ